MNPGSAIFGPRRNETLAEVRARLDRQMAADHLVAALAEFHPRAAAYADPFDWAAQVATVLLTDFDVTRKVDFNDGRIR